MQWRAGGDSFVVMAPLQVRAKIRFSRGSQSNKRKTKASLVIVDGAGVERSIPFSAPEHLLRFARALTVVHGLPLRIDVRLNGHKLDLLCLKSFGSATNPKAGFSSSLDARQLAELWPLPTSSRPLHQPENSSTRQAHSDGVGDGAGDV